MTTRTAELDHFIQLARRGKHPAASGGEGRACQLANVIIDTVPGLDQDALAGAVEFMLLATQKPSTALDLIEGTA